jgi:hypothetical protein
MHSVSAFQSVKETEHNAVGRMLLVLFGMTAVSMDGSAD